MKGRIVKLFAAALLTLLGPVVHATVTYVYTDPQGTPLAEANASGVITATFDYSPYGRRVMGNPTPGPGYTGHVEDPDTGFVYMQARYYDPVVGRFLSVDPLPRGSKSGKFSRYAYASVNPIGRIDPNGMDDFIFGDCSTNPNCSDGSESLASGGAAREHENYQRINDEVAEKATNEANAALSINAALQAGSSDPDQLEVEWAQIVQPIANKYDTEIGAKLFFFSLTHRYKFGPATSDGIICSQSSRCMVNVTIASTLNRGSLVGYTHTHPDNNGLSDVDGSILRRMWADNGFRGTFRVYASGPDLTIWKWTTDALYRTPKGADWRTIMGYQEVIK